MNKNLKWIILYIILNLILIIIPQAQKNNEIKIQLDVEESIEIIPKVEILTDKEFINEIESVLKTENGIQRNYTYDKQNLEYIDIYEVDINLKGEKSELDNVIKNICKLEKFNINELIIDYTKIPAEANIKLISMGGKNG